MVHEQLAFQWNSQLGPNRDSMLSAAWFFFELMIKAMIEHLATTARLGVQRKQRFSEQFHEDIIDLVSMTTSDIFSNKRVLKSEILNSSLAFFLHDLLSVMDRGFVFSLIRSYLKCVSTDNALQVRSSFGFPLPNKAQVLSLQIDFTRIICSHEHFVALNLPSHHPSLEFHLGGTSSPTPSMRSNDSQSSFISHLTEKTHWAELTVDFRKKHFLVGLSLSQLASAFDKPEVQHKAVNAIRNLMTSHDIDTRFSEKERKHRVANLYLPLIAIIIDNLNKLFAWPTEGEVRIVGTNQNEHLNMILNCISDNLSTVRLFPLLFLLVFPPSFLLFLAKLKTFPFSDQRSSNYERDGNEKPADLFPVGFEKCRKICAEAVVDGIAS